MSKEIKKSIKTLDRLKDLHNPDNVSGMARFGINVRNAHGVPMPVLRKMSRELGRDNALACELWDADIHEARILASLVAEPAVADEKQVDRWVNDFDSWDICDQCCGNFIDKTPFARQKVNEWTASNREFVKRAGFVVMAQIAVHDRQAGDRLFVEWLPLIKKAAEDERNFVRKAVNWALRQIGKRNRYLNAAAIKTARDIAKIDSKTARWISSDALRELIGPTAQKLVALRENKLLVRKRKDSNKFS